jgi:hypothetical protein
MASTALSRVSGTVLAGSVREGIIKNGPRQGETWRIENVNVLVAGQNVTQVQLPRRDSSGTLENLNARTVEKGELVDFLCEVSVYGQEVQFRVLELWPADDTADYLVSA